MKLQTLVISFFFIALVTLAGCAEDSGPLGPEPERSTRLGLSSSSAMISGTTGAVLDPVATYSGYMFRYVGNPAPSGYSHDYQWATPRIVTESPEDGPVTMTGTVDIDGMATGQVSMIGFFDLNALAAGDLGFQTGAYMYFFRKTATEWRIGVTDGNSGGEIVQTFITVVNTDLPGDGVLNVVFTVDGTQDGTTCNSGPATSPAGCLSFQVVGGSVNATLTDSYGDVAPLSGASPEFSHGAVPGWDDYVAAGVGYDLTISPVIPDHEGPPTTNVIADPNPVQNGTPLTLTADVDDATTGGSEIAVAEYSLDGGPWMAMDAADGTFDEVAEGVTATFNAPANPGIYDLCVRGTDAPGNVGPEECVMLVVYDPAGGFVTGGGWIESPSGAYMPSDDDVVTESDIDAETDPVTEIDWLRFEANAGNGAFVNGPGLPPLGTGSFEMTATSGSDKVTLFNYDHIGTLLADIGSISYATYRSSASTNPVAQYPAINIQVDFVGDGSSFTTLVWEPIYSYGQAALLTDTWQTWDAMAPSQTADEGGWWSTNTIPGVCEDNCFVSWETIVANNPNAKILGGFGVNIGSGWNGTFSGNTDALSLTANGTTTTYDFEATGPADPTGKANFGFVSKYKKGASIPDGNTEFVFQNADLNFHSTSYEWLVINQGGANAQFKGEGSVNGAGSYQFMLWAGDGTGPNGEDTFRIKIWDDVGVVYDNGMHQPISGGSIKVHQK